ncbi:hypothetical protein DM860_004973 [Cuscuta australis]|uniref:Uncharacterized protein n=1 Tax=Cuscuta australis TaxID=267555 RepID=A0A328DM56_9ASTE|nr:hypothetical protein DM860_004973 [Cuscuta australis]
MASGTDLVKITFELLLEAVGGLALRLNFTSSQICFLGKLLRRVELTVVVWVRSMGRLGAGGGCVGLGDAVLRQQG